MLRAAYRARNLRGGLAHARSERYHQFILWRALVPLWDARFEADGLTDIVIEREGVWHHIEMKNWRDSMNAQIGVVQKDIGRLGPRENGYLVVTSLNPRKQMAENLGVLASKLTGLTEGCQRPSASRPRTRMVVRGSSGLPGGA